MGIYIFNRKLLFDLLQDENKDATDFGKEIIPHSIEKYKVVPVTSMMDTGQISEISILFLKPTLHLCQDIPPFNLI